MLSQGKILDYEMKSDGSLDHDVLSGTPDKKEIERYRHLAKHIIDRFYEESKIPPDGAIVIIGQKGILEIIVRHPLQNECGKIRQKYLFQNEDGLIN
jgi:hypothetical protein